MSSVVNPPPTMPGSSREPGVLIHSRRRRRTRRLLTACVGLLLLAAAAFVAPRFSKGWTRVNEVDAVPVANVQRGDVTLAITARGELRGGDPETLSAPTTGGSEMHLTVLKGSGEQVKPGDIVAQFDTTEQQYKLQEARADLAEAEQHTIQAKAQRDAEREENSYAFLKAQSDLKLAELDVRKNPLLAAITAKQNDLALASARDRLAQVQQNLTNRAATGEAGIAMQEAGHSKAEAQAATALQNIESMTLRAKRAGYVSIKANSNQNFGYGGMVLPLFQVGDTVRPGMAIAEIPDLHSWELAANIGELDRGHLAIGQPVNITVIAEPGRQFHGHVKELGGTTGAFWDRHFECKMALDDPSPELRPGMSAQIVVTTEELRHVLWVPSQALFDRDGKMFVYLHKGSSFVPQDIQLVRRNETRAVVSGLREGDVVALANPVEMAQKKTSGESPLKTVSR